MRPQLLTRGSFAVLGVTTRIRRGSESPELFGRIWKTFESRQPQIESAATQKAYFGVNFPTDEEGVTEYLTGMMVAAGTPAPEGLEVRTVPGGQYAVFECPVDAIGAAYQHAFGVWLPGEPVQFDAGRAPFEEYPENTPEQPVRIHIPVRQQATEGLEAGVRARQEGESW
jgi:predicted transcriptional regulator YdeE